MGTRQLAEMMSLLLQPIIIINMLSSESGKWQVAKWPSGSAAAGNGAGVRGAPNIFLQLDLNFESSQNVM